MEFQEQHPWVPGGWWAFSGLDFSVIVATAIVNPTEPLLKDRMTRGGSPIWSAGDHNNLSQDTNGGLAWAICEEHAGESAASLSGASDGGQGVSRGFTATLAMAKPSNGEMPKSVVTLSRLPLPKRGRYLIRGAVSGLVASRGKWGPGEWWVQGQWLWRPQWPPAWLPAKRRIAGLWLPLVEVNAVNCNVFKGTVQRNQRGVSSGFNQ
jgi:hypothetical protein